MNTGQWAALGRHVVSYAAGGITVFVGMSSIAFSLHMINADQLSQLSTAFQALGDGVKTVAGAVGTIASVGMAVWASYASSHQAQAASVASVPGTTIVTDPKLAAAVPATNVVPNTTSQVVAR